MLPIRVYIAGKFDAQARLRRIRDALQSTGRYRVVGTWLDEEKAAPGGGTCDWSKHAKRDVAEVLLADLLILDTIDDNNRGGREVEFGVALARGIPTLLVGPRRNVFHHVACGQFDEWCFALRYLGVPDAVIERRAA